VKPRNLKPEVKVSPALSLLARPGDGSIRTRCIAILVAPGVDGGSLERLHRQLSAEGAKPRYVGLRLGTVRSADGPDIDVEITLETGPSVLFDAVVIPDGAEGVAALAKSGHAVEFVKDQFRHCKAMLALGAGEQLLDAAGIPAGAADSGLLRFTDASDAAKPFIAAVAKHRHFERQTDPPII
jgi:catalase